MKKIAFALVGQPNCGKTTLFNQLTGSTQRVGNWPGVTVERKSGLLHIANHTLELVDLPGTYSVANTSADDPSAHCSPDELITCQYVRAREAAVIINVVDASNPLRHLYLTLQLAEMGLPMIVVLNMTDIARQKGIHFDTQALSHALHCPVISMTSTRGEGLQELKTALARHVELAAEASTNMQPLPEENVQQAAVRYNKIKALLADVLVTTANEGKVSFTQRCDRLVLNRWLGIPIFLFIMYLMFVLSVNVGGALQPLFELSSTALFIDGIQWLGATLHFPTWLTLLLAQGIGGGINTVLPLIPQIGLMYLFMTFLEDSGYMARAAFVIDRLMQSLGLPGKAFVPLIVGFGCNVPAVIGTRTLDNPRERLITMMMAPFIPCGARLAIFALFSTAFFGRQGAWVIFSLYLIGIMAALLTGLLLRYTLLRGESAPFVMELPEYHRPHCKSLLLQTWVRLKSFIFRAGKVIVVASVIIGCLNSFNFHRDAVTNSTNSALADIGVALTPLLHPIGVQQDNWQATVGLISGAMAKEIVAGTLNTLYTAEALEENRFDPATFSLSEALIAAVKETWQSITELFSLQTFVNPIEASKGDGDMSQGAMGIMSEKFQSPVAAFSYLLFVLLYVPCASVMGAIAREENQRWMLFSIFWGLVLAYSISTLFYQATELTTHFTSAVGIVATVLFINLLIVAIMRKINIVLPKHSVIKTVAKCTACSGCPKRNR